MTGKVKRVALFVLVTISGIIAAAVLYFYNVFYHSDVFLPGVHIANLSVTGLTPEEAEEKLNDYLKNVFNTNVVFTYDNYTYVCKLSDLTNLINIHEVVENAFEKEKNRSIQSKILNMDGSKKINYPIPIPYNTLILQELEKEWEKNIGIPYQDARLEFNAGKGLIIIPEKEGLKVDAEATLAELPKTLEGVRDNISIPLIVKKVIPEVKAEDLRNIGKLASYTTWYDSSLIDRSHNLSMAAKAINGSVVRPGEVFSFNSVVGERTFAAGYRDALVIIGGKFTPGVGGGICQVSSTLYNAVLLAGLPVVERHNHTLAVAYVPLGFDATVAYGLQDFKFKNNTDSPLYIITEVGAGKLTVSIYGNLNYRQHVKTSHVIDKVMDFSEIREFKPELRPGEEKIETKGNPGYIVRSFRSFYDDKGTLIKTEMLARDVYAPLNRLIYVGPELEINAPGEKDKETITDMDSSVLSQDIPGQEDDAPGNNLPDQSENNNGSSNRGEEQEVDAPSLDNSQI
ncbi:VanW family protein [Thermosyntropha sp.]|uniref:VanW family protein n=1 Tax=Thermosyntropha sp. TaxID=2740820 RepID=UPI0025D75964|nr:VanW family protein [Thermosyntropha sp.]MBO8159809.1 VanW family protein [Thermosyntropha sp.]